MKRLFILLLICALLAGCGGETVPQVTEVTQGSPTAPEEAPVTQIPFESRFSGETTVALSDSGIDVTGPNSLFVYVSNDIVYYEDRETYDSGNPYGEGEETDRHSEEEAAAHTVVNITVPGCYRITGKLSAGQIRIDLGDKAYDDETAVVELILENADITCTVAPVILFRNVYECDGNWSADTATADVDTSAAGANLILEGENTLSGSYVAKIYKDKEGEKKLWKQDGAIYSYMSMNVYGPGSLDLTAENEGIDTELHLTFNGGNIAIRSGNDGINTNEDDVSVTTVNGGSLHITAGLGEEGDGIDSNGYLVINGGKVVSAAHPASDAGLDSSCGSFVHGGTVIALGAAMDWAESESGQVTVNLQFDSYQTGAILFTREDGTPVFSYDPRDDELLGENARRYQGAILSCGNFRRGETYNLFVDGVAMAYTGTDVTRGGPGGKGGFGGQHPEGQIPPGGFGGDRPQGEPGEMPTMPEGEVPPSMPEGEIPPSMPEGEVPPSMPEGEMPPSMPEGEMPQGGFDKNRDPGKKGVGNTDFYMQDMVNFFSGVGEAE